MNKLIRVILDDPITILLTVLLAAALVLIFTDVFNFT